MSKFDEMIMELEQDMFEKDDRLLVTGGCAKIMILKSEVENSQEKSA